MIRVTELRLALALLAVAACSGDVTAPSRQAPGTPGGGAPLLGILEPDARSATLIDCPAATTQSVTSRIGFSGGVLSLGNTRVVIPLGAVLFPQEFTLTVPASRYAEIRVRTGSAEHYLFQVPIAMTIDYSRCATAETDRRALTVWNIDPDTKALLAPMIGVDEKLTHTIVFTTIHLSGYAVADRAETDTGE